MDAREDPQGDAACVMYDAWDDRLDLSENLDRVLAALTSARSVECAECDEGNVPWESGDGDWHDAPCEFCSGSGRIEKGPIAYLAGELEQVSGSAYQHENGRWMTSLGTPHDSVPVFRILPDESPKGGA